MKFILNKILDILNNIIKYLTNLTKRLNKRIVTNLKIVGRSYKKDMKMMEITITNFNYLSGEVLLKSIYRTLRNDLEFENFAKNKSIIISQLDNNREISFHHNILINSETTENDYISKVLPIIQSKYDGGYLDNDSTVLIIKCFSLDEYLSNNKKINEMNKIKNLRGFHTNTISKNVNLTHITPLKQNNSSLKNIITMDIETIKFNDIQIPIAISLAYNYMNSIKTEFILIDNNLLKMDSNKAINDLFNNLIIILNRSPIINSIIFIHNLGSFDGYFLYKYLSNILNPKDITTIIDHHNKFIQITIIINNIKIVWKDSFRIFPVSLNELCTIFNVEGKLSNYKTSYNYVTLLSNINLLKEFKSYSIQDSVALLQALTKAQNIYHSIYNLDITSIWSTSTLSLNIFRSKFLNTNIPILNQNIDKYIRDGYYGGATDYYYKYGENLYHYDVNSLYPFSMCKPMPFNIDKFYNDLSNINLNDFFGFCLAKIECPKNINIPLLPFKFENKLIFPTGKWIGVYFSEELKEVVKFGYKIELISGYSFTKIDLFNDYVNHFYLKKKTSIGAKRFIAKMHLNQLYGYFGRNPTLIETINIDKSELYQYLTTRIIKSIIEINDKICTILINTNLDFETIDKLNSIYNTNFINKFKIVKSNVAIAAAVTSYSRIEMIKYKTLNNIKVFYTDTDSIFTDKPLPDHMVSNELGKMKDELNGIKIDKAYFLGIKKYGYIYYKDNNLIYLNQDIINNIYKIHNIHNYNDFIYGNSNEMQILHQILKNDPQVASKFTSIIIQDLIRENSNLFITNSEIFFKYFIKLSLPLGISLFGLFLIFGIENFIEII